MCSYYRCGVKVQVNRQGYLQLQTIRHTIQVMVNLIIRILNRGKGTGLVATRPITIINSYEINKVMIES